MVIVAAEEGRIRGGKGGDAFLHVSPVVRPGNAAGVIREHGGTHRKAAQGGKFLRAGACQFAARVGGIRRSVPGSNAFVPSVAGLIIGGEVVKDLVGFVPMKG